MRPTIRAINAQIAATQRELALQRALAATATPPSGPPGPSAYDVAVANGFVGTQAAWLASLQGPPGADGADGAGLAPMGLWDWWHDYRLGTTGAAAGDVFVGAAVSSGTNSTAIPAAAVLGYNPLGVFLRSSTTANGGYRYQTSSVITGFLGAQVAWKFRAQFLWRSSFVGRLVRLGFHDTATSADAVDGAYFEIDGDACRAKTANNSVRTTAAQTLTLSLDVPYTFDIEANAAGTEVRFRVWGGVDPAALLDTAITSNLPVAAARAFGAGIVATEASTTASDIGILYSLGLGTLPGFQRARG